MTQFMARMSQKSAVPALAATAVSSVMAVPLTVVNPSFESQVLTCTPSASCFIDGVIPGWSVSSIPQTATFKPSTGIGGIFPAGIPQGVNVAGVGNQNGIGAISQALGTTLQPNTTYTLSVGIGHRADFPFSGYAVELLAGASVLVSSSVLNPGPGVFLTDLLSVTTTAGTIGLGQSISIRLRSLSPGAQVDFDNVSLDAVAVPEPSQLALLLPGIAFVLAAYRQRSRVHVQQ